MSGLGLAGQSLWLVAAPVEGLGFTSSDKPQLLKHGSAPQGASISGGPGGGGSRSADPAGEVWAAWGHLQSLLPHAPQAVHIPCRHRWGPRHCYLSGWEQELVPDGVTPLSRLL